MNNSPSKKRQFIGNVFRHAIVGVAIAAVFLLFHPKCATAEWLLFGRAQRQYDRCVRLYEEEQFDEARECVSNFLASYPNSRWVEHLQFLDAKMETNADEAERKLRRFVIDFPDGQYAGSAYFSLGEIYELQGDVTNALKYYSRLYDYFSSDTLRDEAGLRMAKCMLLTGDTEQAITHLRKFLSTHHSFPWDVRGRELLGDALYQAGEYMEAQEKYKEVISEASSPQEASPHCYLRIAEIYEIHKDYAAAFQAYRQFLNIFPNAFQKQAVEQKLGMLASLLKVDLSSGERAYTIEAGTFESEHEAMSLATRLKRLGYQAYVVTRTANQGESLSVRLGPYESRDSALVVADRLAKEADIKVNLLPQGGSF